MHPMDRPMSWFQKIKILIVVIIGVSALVAGAYVYTQSQEAALPNAPAAVIKVDQLNQTLNQLSTREKVASLLMVHVAGTDPQRMADFIGKYQPGGIILMGDNLTDDLTQVKALTSTAQESAQPFPIFIAIDEEGCSVKRLPQDTFACAKDLGSQPVFATEQAFSQRSKLLQQAGINLNFGIVADLSSNPDSFIHPRVFGSDPEQVGSRVAAAVKASPSAVLTSVKHFPGHGQTTADSHKTIPQIESSEQAWQDYAAIPFKSGIKAGVDAVMFGHLIYTHVDSQPASLSHKWHNHLHQKLGFDGLTITDDLIMLQQSGEPAYQDTVSNVIASINAGNTITLLVNDHNADEQPQTQINLDSLLEGVIKAADDGRLSIKVIDQSALKVLHWRSSLSAMNE